MRKWLFFFMALFLLTFISANCEEGQIDVNTASSEKLEEIHGIGPVKAEAIVNTRPYKSLDDLINVYGIGEKTLESIKSQGLACVEKEEDEENPEEEIFDIRDEIRENKEEILVRGDIYYKEEIVPKKMETINLNPKDIKSDGDGNKTESNYVIYGLIAFCLLLGFLFLIKIKRRQFSEFK